MKTLINKHNPAIRITAPEIEEYEHFYSIPNWYGYNKSDWELVAEEPTEGIRGKKEEIPSNVDLEKKEQISPLKGKFIFPKFLYARTINNKTIDVSYAPQSLDAVEYIRSDSLQQEHTEVDLEREIDREWKKCSPTDEGMGVETANIHIEAFDMITRHFYELGKKGGKV